MYEDKKYSSDNDASFGLDISRPQDAAGSDHNEDKPTMREAMLNPDAPIKLTFAQTMRDG